MVTTKISSAEIETAAIVGEVSRAWIKGTDTASVDMLAASRHPPLRVLRAYAQLAEVPDATATTVTVKLQNNGTDMSDTLTFTQGTDAVGKLKQFALTSNQDVVAKASALTLVAAGTTATAGEVIVTVQFENI